MLLDFAKLYSKSTSLKSIKSLDDENYKTFSLKKGLPVTLVQTSKFIKELYPLKNFYDFFKNHKYFYMIPIATPSRKIIGFILRGFYNKEYRTIFNVGDLSPMFGFEDFKDFSTNKPILLCEGTKDAIYLKKWYPYTLSLQTSNITNVNFSILSKLSDKFILCYDNDDTGIKSSASDRDMLISNGIVCETIKPHKKDCAEYLTDSTDEDLFLNELKYKLNILGGKHGIN